MAKSFKQFRDEWDDDWNSDDDDHRGKDKKMKDRRDQRRRKTQDRFAKFENKDDE